jgi:hypothetical protein
MVTVSHLDFYSFTSLDSPLRGGGENIDGTVRMVSYGGYTRPTTFQEAKGLGVKAWDGNDFPGGDGVVYYPDKNAGEVPSHGNDRTAYCWWFFMYVAGMKGCIRQAIGSSQIQGIVVFLPLFFA